jgi:hypothetical protein
VAQGVQLPNIEGVDDLDQHDLDIVALLGAPKKPTYRDLANKTGLSLATVFSRVRRIRQSDWAEEMREALRGLGENCIRAIQGAVDSGESKDRGAISLRLLDGLGVTVPKSEVVNRNAPVTSEQFLEQFDRMPADEKDAIITGLTGRSTDSSG